MGVCHCLWAVVEAKRWHASATNEKAECDDPLKQGGCYAQNSPTECDAACSCGGCLTRLHLASTGRGEKMTVQDAIDQMRQYDRDFLIAIVLGMLFEDKYPLSQDTELDEKQRFKMRTMAELFKDPKFR